MALLCYAHKLCLRRSLKNCGYCPRKIIFLFNNWYFLKKELSSRGICSNTGYSSGTQNAVDSLGKSFVPEVMDEDKKSSSDDLSTLEEPTTCCMSGCANCVWIEYAEELSKRFKDGGEKARESIMKISDPNMRAFLLTELKTLEKS